MLASRASARRHGAALLLALSFAGALVVGACGALGESAFGPSGGAGDSGAGGDTGASFDASTDTALADTGIAGDGEASRPTTALLVQASPSLPDVRLCAASSGVVLPLPPFPGDGVMPGSNYPGIPLGGVAAMSDATALVGPGITLYALDAENLARIEQGAATAYTCEELVCGPGSNLPPPCLRYDLDYWPVSIGGSGVVARSDNVVALGGCLASALDPNASTTLCGPTWSAGSGNLHADVLQLVASASTVGPLGSVQAAQLSPALGALEGDGGSALVSFGAEGTDAAFPVAVLHGEGDLSAPTGIVFDAGLAGYGQLGFAVDVPGIDGGAGHAWMSLADSQQLVDPTEDPTLFFGQPRTYLVAVLGDPDAPHAFAPAAGDAGYDGKGLHLLVVAAPLADGGAGDAGAGDP